MIETLAVRQLAAYNDADLDAFCDCYHPAVVVFDGDARVAEGITAFRERYRAKFEAGGFGGTVSNRVVAGDHCVEHERWWVDGPEGRVEGELLVRYSLRDGRIGVVQFLRPRASS